MLLINIHYPTENLHSFIKTNQKSIKRIIDFSGLLNNDNIKLDALKNLNHSEKILELGTRHYLEFSGELSREKFNSRKFFRDVKIDGLPLYWVTPLGVKFPYKFHFRNFFLLLSYLKVDKQDYSGYNKIVIALPENCPELQDTIKQHIGSEAHKLEFIAPNQSLFAFRKFTSFIKLYTKNVMDVMKFRISSINTENIEKSDGNFFYSFPVIDSDSKYEVARVDDINHFVEKERNTRLSMLPQRIWVQQAQVPDFKISEEYLQSKPGIFQLITIGLQCITTFLQVLLIKPENRTVHNVYLNTGIIKKQMLLSIPGLVSDLILMKWMDNFLRKRNKPTVIFYEDEFYITGRCISHVIAKHKEVKGIGHQHGQFTDVHTVYNISTNEMQPLNSATDGLPKPTYFVVWGDYFKNIYLKNNADDASCLTLGNPQFIRKKQNLPVVSASPKRLLWCISNKEFFFLELPYIKSINTTHPEYKIAIRNHPIRGVTMQELEENLENNSYTVSEELNIYDDILASEVIFVSGISTVFMESAVAERPVFRMIGSYQDSSMEKDYEGLYHVRSVKELEEKFLKYKTNTTGNHADNFFLYLKNDRWSEFVRSL
ncbi:MAG: hypothetical protein H6607_09875 [Flavobacteriales bacterium]|nr:hypothetical protein [Flavobacteriales bacterium]